MDVPESFKTQHEKWIKVVNDRDIKGYANLLTENAVWMPPGQKPVIGRDAFKQWLTPFMSEFSYEFIISEERVRVTGDWALEKARFTSRMTPSSGGETREHSGTFTVLWKRAQDRKWYIDRYMDDTNL